MSIIAVTGAAGFIASHIADALIEEGHDVHILDDLSGGKRENVNPGAEFHEVDIRSAEAASLFEKYRFDTLVHHAAQMDVRKSVADPSFDADVNVRGTLNLLESGRKNGLNRVIFASTGGAIYGEPDYAPQDEAHPLRPMSPYGITKLSVEKYLAFYHHEYGLDYVALRYGNVYGPRQNPHGEAGVIAIFAKRMLAGDKVYINGDGLQTRDYVFVHDVVRANLAALKFPQSGTFNIGTGIETTVTELFLAIRRFTGAPIEEEHAKAQPGEQRRSVLSASHAGDVLSWAPDTDVEEGLRKTVEWFRESP